MKKITAFIIALILIFALPLAAFAEESTVPSEPSEETTESFSPEMILDYIQAHLEEISVVFTLICTAIYNARKHKILNGSIGTLNNNSVSIAENSKSAIDKALEVVAGYKEQISELLAEVRTSEEEKRQLINALAQSQKLIESSKLANVELANEVAELLVLANIPNSKKDELYARHLAAVGKISEVDAQEVAADESDGTEE